MTFEQVFTASAVGADGRHEAAVPARDVAELFRAHHVSLVRLALLMLGDRTSAEDIVQDVYARPQRRHRRSSDPPADLLRLAGLLSEEIGDHITPMTRSLGPADQQHLSVLLNKVLG